MESNNKIEYWKKYREELTKEIMENINIEKTPENIYEMAKKIGIKPTARYFDIYPSTVRYYVQKIESQRTK